MLGSYGLTFSSESCSRGNTLVNAATGEDLPLAMQHLSLSGQVSPAGALLRATHQFKCAGAQPMEALYIFMLPRGAILRRFIVKGDGFEVESKLSPREEARKEYEAGVGDGHLSTLAEMNSDGMVSLAVGQVQPDEIITVIVELVAGVDVSDGHYRFRFPFTLAPSYHAQAKMTSTGTGGKVELPSSVFGDLVLPEWTKDTENLHSVSFKIQVDAGGPLDSVASPSHRILVRPGADGSAEVELSALGDTPNRDLVLDVAAKSIEPVVFADQKLVNQTTEAGDPNISVLAPRWTAVIPSLSLPKAANRPREVCFVLDRSGSMAGDPLERAKVALKACLSALSPADKVGFVHFGSDAVRFDKTLCLVTDANRKRAQKWIDEIYADGGTELAPALGEAVEILETPGKDVFVLTDGQVFETGPIIEQCAAAGTRIHVLGIGSASQDRFLASLARRTGGVERMVGVTEDVAAAALGMFNAIRQPVQTDVKATVEMDGGAQVQEHDIGTVWEGKSLLITDNGQSGEFRPIRVNLSWAPGQDIVVDLPNPRPTPNGLSAMLWAGHKVEDLESQLDMSIAGPAAEAIEGELRTISTDYGLASRVMSLCAVVKRPGDKPGEMTQQIVPVGMPEGMGNVFAPAISAAFVATLGGFSSYNSPGLCCSMGTGSNHSTPTFTSYLVSNQASGSWESRSFGLVEREDAPIRPGSYAIRGLSCQGAQPRKKRIGFAAPVFDLFTELGKLESDGGLPGKTPEDRFVQTILLVLVTLAAETENTGSPLFRSHLNRMVGFITGQEKVFKGHEGLIQKVLAAGSVPGDWQKEYTGYKGHSDKVWKALESAFGV